jgi:sterol desaturase/sphingolipid hydroxylase (fatty acid hydroxylase superfamily)
VSGASYHDFHHSKNIGNFAGSVYLWDTIYKENDIYWEKFIENAKINDR